MYYLYESVSGLALFREKHGQLKLVGQREFDGVDEAMQHQQLEKTKTLKKLLKEVPEGKTLCVKTHELALLLRDKLGLPDAKQDVGFESNPEFQRLLKELDLIPPASAHLNLCYSMARLRLEINSESVDRLIVEAANLLEQADKEANTFLVALAEWVTWSFPESVRLLPGFLLAKAHAIIGGDKRFYQSEAKMEVLKSELDDQELVQELVAKAQISAGTDISPEDIEKIAQLAQQVNQLLEQRAQIKSYVENRTQKVAPNLCALVTPLVAARLLMKAHSLKKLAVAPASTLQILGSELTLFNAQREQSSSTPKFGFIYSIVAQQAGSAADMGRVARQLACKASIASRLDCLSVGKPTGSEYLAVKAKRLQQYAEKQKKEADVAPAAQDADEMDTLFLEGPKPRRMDKQ